MSRKKITQEQVVEPSGEITAEDAALIWGDLRSETVRQWRRRGLLEGVRVKGLGWLFRLNDVRAMYNSRFDLFKPR